MKNKVIKITIGGDYTNTKNIDIEDIKTEIEGLKHEHTDVNGYRWWNNAIDNVLHIIRDAVEE